MEWQGISLRWGGRRCVVRRGELHRLATEGAKRTESRLVSHGLGLQVNVPSNSCRKGWVHCKAKMTKEEEDKAEGVYEVWMDVVVEN